MVSQGFPLHPHATVKISRFPPSESKIFSKARPAGAPVGVPWRGKSRKNPNGAGKSEKGGEHFGRKIYLYTNWYHIQGPPAGAPSLCRHRHEHWDLICAIAAVRSSTLRSPIPIPIPTGPSRADAAARSPQLLPVTPVRPAAYRLWITAAAVREFEKTDARTQVNTSTSSSTRRQQCME